jgi:hypothetical protein
MEFAVNIFIVHAPGENPFGMANISGLQSLLASSMA